MNLVNSLFGTPIECTLTNASDQKKIQDNVIRSYCWIHTTFSVESAWNKDLDLEVPYPGIGKHVLSSTEKRKYHAYYQWVWVVLFIQALFFYAPRWIWKTMENGRVEALAQPLWTYKNRSLIVKYLVNSRPQHNLWFFTYVVLEVLNLLNVIIQAIIIDKFLGHQFLTYGLDVIKFTDWKSRVSFDPMLKVFPRMTKCTFNDFGPSGDVTKYDAMCVLPINIVNEKIYIFLWFWFCFLAVISVLGLVYRLATLVSPRVRQLSTYSRKRIDDSETRNAVKSIIWSQGCGTWFFLELLSRNIEALIFRKMLVEFDQATKGNNRANFEQE